jgi:hypothetical protein
VMDGACRRLLPYRSERADEELVDLFISRRQKDCNKFAFR